MKTALVLTATLLPWMAHADNFQVTAPVTAVTLYPAQAEITRSASHALPAGRHQLTIAGLPELDLDNLQVTVDGVTLLGVRQGQSSEAEDVSQRREQLDQQIAELEQALSAAANADRLDQQQIEHLLSLLGQSPQGPALYSEVPVQQWSNAWSQIRQAVDQRQAEINARAAARPGQEKQLAALKQQRQQLGREQQQRHSVIVDVQADSAAEAALALRYYTRQASWQNQLQVNLLSDAEQVAVSAIAEMHNRTGEDWQQVSLSLGLLPAGYRALPEPTPWIIRLARERAERDMRARKLMAEPAMMSADMALESAPRAPAPVLETLGMDLRVNLGGGFDLPSDGSTVRQPYQQASLPVTLSRESYLWQQPNVLLVGEWQNSADVPWLAGPVTLLRDGQRLTRYHRHQSIQQGEQVRMSFGDDPRLQVEVSQRPLQRGETGLISRENTLALSTRVTVKSAYDTPVSIDLYDRLPVPEDEQIKVSAKGQSADETNVRDVKGLQRWSRELAPGAEWVLEKGIEVRYPRDAELSGVPGLFGR